MNLAIGIVMLGLDRRSDPAPVPASPPVAVERASPASPLTRFLPLLFAASGFAALGYEIHWTRALHHFLGNSTYAYSAMLTTFLFGLSLGGWVGGQLGDRIRARDRLLGWIQIGIAGNVVGTVVLIWGWLPGPSAEALLAPDGMGWKTYLTRRFLVAFAVMIVPTTLLGATFPIVTRLGIDDLTRLGRGVGGLYFANTLGAILGSLAAGFVVMPWLGPKAGLLATAILSGAVGATVFLLRKDRASAESLGAVAVVVLIAVLAIPVKRAGAGFLSDTQDLADSVLFEAEDPIAATRVYQKPNGDRHMSVDGHDIGGSGVGLLRKQKVLAHLPLVLVPEARRILAVGLGSGITLGTLARYEEVESLTCIEIVPGVVKGAELFSEFHGNVLADPRTEVLVEDGIQFLLTTEESFDVISSDSKINPHYVGNAPLLARDYYELCRNRLTETGVMVQWLPLHLPASEMQMIVRSFVEAFPHTALFWHYPYNVIQAGSPREIVVDLDRARGFAGDPQLKEDFEFLQLQDPYALASLFVTAGRGMQRALGEGPVNSWLRPRLEFTVIRANLEKPTALHEDDNLRWLLRHRDFSGPPVTGEQDPEVLRRFLFSSSKLLQGYAEGGGIGFVANGRHHFEEGLAGNPDDWRLRHILEVLDRGRTSTARPGSLR